MARYTPTPRPHKKINAIEVDLKGLLGGAVARRLVNLNRADIRSLASEVDLNTTFMQAIKDKLCPSGQDRPEEKEKTSGYDQLGDPRGWFSGMGGGGYGT